MKLAFLLGSGSSRRAGMPSTDDITDWVLQGTHAHHHTDGRYYIADDTAPQPDRNQIDTSIALAKWVFEYILAYYQMRRSNPTNYESIAYVLSQVAETISGNFDNPAVIPLIEKMKSNATILGNCGDQELQNAAQEAANYIADIAWSLLDRQPESVDYLRFIADAQTENDGATYVFTLNHDLVLEGFLSKNKITYDNGFGAPVNGVQYWQGIQRKDEDRSLRVVKLHGSIDWFRYRIGQDTCVAIPGPDPCHALDSSGKLLPLTLEPRPLLLVGTFNKMYSYTSGVFADLHCCFHSVLKASEMLVCAGYGFGDKGINTKIVQWLNVSSPRRLVVIHPNPTDLRNCSRGAIEQQWDEWKGSGRLTEITKRVEEVSWVRDVRPLF